MEKILVEPIEVWVEDGKVYALLEIDIPVVTVTSVSIFESRYGVTFDPETGLWSDEARWPPPIKVDPEAIERRR